MTHRPLLEIAVQDIAGARTALAAGADRLELCSALATGGLTPSLGLIEAVVELGAEVHVLVRAMAGDLVVGRDELEVLQRDVRLGVDAGASAIVTGVLDRGWRTRSSRDGAARRGRGGRPRHPASGDRRESGSDPGRAGRGRARREQGAHLGWRCPLDRRHRRHCCAGRGIRGPAAGDGRRWRPSRRHSEPRTRRRCRGAPVGSAERGAAGCRTGRRRRDRGRDGCRNRASGPASSSTNSDVSPRWLLCAGARRSPRAVRPARSAWPPRARG